ncbi:MULTISPECIES: DUF4230 domain-containing protein [Psychrobacter]|uniref:DUF4230 domain-containing protein n=1 Tax=Psychrobacter alimentarius TaxID=261164 RepID=A0ABN4MZV0_9GAMM|nr:MULTISPECIES: DUF4230 domain-containing protein [Psychrobacter]AMT96173.1 hypothetical protein A3K91_0547 [Psychrobacter alimentarius]QCB31414.1 DUF4230 domain-containing protein [Psychrobacter sp. PAMC27889]
MNKPDNRSSINNSAPNTSAKKPIAPMSWIVLLIGLAAIVFAIYSVQNITKEEPIETITREGVVTQIQQLNRLQTVAFSVDTVITSKRPGSWMKLWQDEQKGLFIARGRVQAGIDLSALTPEMVQVVQPEPSSADQEGAQTDSATSAASLMPTINITLPPSEIFAVYLDDIEIYDWQTGAFGMMQVDPKILAQAQSMAKEEVLERACRGDVMNMALKNAQTQLQQLFAMTGAVVTVTTQGAGACQLPVASSANG